jgi:glycosyltransferase involved in cell wall biosynthesis
MTRAKDQLGIAVVIPCYQVESHLSDVLERIGPSVSRIYCVDDGSTDGTARVIARASNKDSRVKLVPRSKNGGVGAAVLDGYRTAIGEGHKVIVKLDGDGQMDPASIPSLVQPILGGRADYVKGNRFTSIQALRQMPVVRLWGNAGLSFLSKASTGYWDLFDPTNGYTAIEAGVAAALPLEKIHPRYFFESDILFRLGTLRARVVEVPMVASYGEERSHLSPFRALITFPFLHLRNVVKRIAYNHFLRNFSLAAVHLVVGLTLAVGGGIFGILKWSQSSATGIPATAGSVMLSALPILVGTQLVLSFLAYDMSQVPRDAIHRYLAPRHAPEDAPEG